MIRVRAVFGIGAALAAVLASACFAADAAPATLGVVRVGGLAHVKPADAIRLTTYNIENLFDDKDDPSLTGDEDDWYSKDQGIRAKPASQREAVSKAIRAIDADVIAVEEIESYDALTEFRTQYLEGLGYDYVMSIDAGADRGMQQGVLSRFPIREARVWPQLPLGGVHPENYGTGKNWYAGQPIVFRRSPLYVRVEVPAGARGNTEAYDLDLFVVHHKSGKYNDYWREKEVPAVVAMVKELESRDPKANIAVLGDFNAEASEAAVQTYEKAGMTHADTSGSADPTRISHSSGRTIDFILVNANLRKEIVDGSPFAFGTPVLPEDADWRTTPPPADFASDHMPISVDIVPVNK